MRERFKRSPASRISRAVRHDLQVLAAGNALRMLAGDRCQAIWQASSAVPDKDLLRPADLTEEKPVLAQPKEGESIVSDYRPIGLTLVSATSTLRVIDGFK
jgi:hypothetical protein